MNLYFFITQFLIMKRLAGNYRSLQRDAFQERSSEFWLYIAESACAGCKVLRFEKCIRTGMNILKIILWGGKLSVS